MGHQQDMATPCGNRLEDGSPCPGAKTTIYVYDDHGNCISQQSYPCGYCGNQ